MLITCCAGRQAVEHLLRRAPSPRPAPRNSLTTRKWTSASSSATRISRSAAREVLLGDLPFALQLAEDVWNLSAETFEHRVPWKACRPRVSDYRARPRGSRLRSASVRAPPHANLARQDRRHPRSRQLRRGRDRPPAAAGADVFRLNLSHGTTPATARTIAAVRQAARAAGTRDPGAPRPDGAALPARRARRRPAHAPAGERITLGDAIVGGGEIDLPVDDPGFLRHLPGRRAGADRQRPGRDRGRRQARARR